MTNEQLENAFNEAREQWNRTNDEVVAEGKRRMRLARYFFFAGSEFGMKTAKEIYRETYAGLSPEHKRELTDIAENSLDKLEALWWKYNSSSVPPMPADLDAIIHAEKG